MGQRVAWGAGPLASAILSPPSACLLHSAIPSSLLFFLLLNKKLAVRTSPPLPFTPYPYLPAHPPHSSRSQTTSPSITHSPTLPSALQSQVEYGGNHVGTRLVTIAAQSSGTYHLLHPPPTTAHHHHLASAHLTNGLPFPRCAHPLSRLLPFPYRPVSSATSAPSLVSPTSPARLFLYLHTCTYEVNPFNLLLACTHLPRQFSSCFATGSPRQLGG